jgi:predicted transcriptional regulator
MKTIKIGILPQAEIRQRTIDIAAGIYKPKPDDPKIWFTSLKSLSQVLSDENQALLKVILETEPQSLSELTKKTGRKLSNLSRTLKTLENYQLIRLVKNGKRIRPFVNALSFQVTFGPGFCHS